MKNDVKGNVWGSGKADTSGDVESRPKMGKLDTANESRKVKHMGMPASNPDEGTSPECMNMPENSGVKYPMGPR
jgi:hypothetical protein